MATLKGKFKANECRGFGNLSCEKPCAEVLNHKVYLRIHKWKYEEGEKMQMISQMKNWNACYRSFIVTNEDSLSLG